MTVRRGGPLLLAAIICLTVDALPAAQEPSRSTSPAFDVVSIKQATGPLNGCKYLQDRVSCRTSLLELIREAYQVDYFRLDAPEWMAGPHIGGPQMIGGQPAHADTFLLEATMPAGTIKEAARLMLRQALADRFALKVHRETRIILAYALIAGKHGVKLQLAEDPDNPKMRSITTAAGTFKGFEVRGPGVFLASAIPLDSLAEKLTYEADLDRPVVNLTGLTGKYDFDLHWDPTPGIVYGMKDPAFLATLRSELGLELEKRNLPVEVLVIDHAETAPSAN